MQGFNCANCGAAVELRALSQTRAVACTSCGAVIDARDRNVTILQTAAARQPITPRIPLGSRGEWAGRPHDVIGFQQRSITVEGQRYAWDEYVLFNPYVGFRYLTEYNGHWNDVTTVRELPSAESGGGRPAMSLGDEIFKHFQHATARTDFVLGEFPWRVQVGEEVVTDDFVEPPYMLSGEGTENERTWSRGTYTDPRQIWKAFNLPALPPAPTGVFANQPNPYAERSRALWSAFRWLSLLVVVLMLYRLLTASGATIFAKDFRYQPGLPESSFVTEPFTLQSDGTVEVKVATSLSNSWLGFDLALINLDTGDAHNTDSEISFYSGVEGGERWSEGSTSATLSLPRLPAGQYYIRVEPEGPPNGPQVPYKIIVRRDVADPVPYLLALVLLTLPPIWVWFRKAGFEARRNAESDYAPSGANDDDDVDEDEDEDE
jgi:DNA-directed RNA polymerase subunit RPC12/RpoP